MPNPSTGRYGAQITIEEDLSAEGYTFTGWHTAEGSLVSVADNDVNFFMPDGDVTLYGKFSMRTDLAYTVKYYWIGDNTKTIKDDLVVNDQTFDAEVTLDDEQMPDIVGFTLIPDEYNVRIGVGENVVKVYYYKNVTLTANNDDLTYNGVSQSLSGYTASVDGLTFNGVVKPTVTATNAGEYPLTFVESPVGQKDSTGEYIVAAATPGKLTINKLPVTVTAQDINVAYGKPVENLTATKSAAGGVVIPADFEDVVTYTLAHDGGETPNVGQYPIYFKIGEREIKEIVTDKDFYRNYEVTFDPGTLTVTDDNVPPETVVKKTHDDRTYGEGDTITYTITVKNIYNVVKKLTVTEQKGVEITTPIPADLQPGESVTLKATYTVQKKDMVNGSFKNTVTVKLGDNPFQDDDTVTFTANPKLTVEKTITNGGENKSFALGESIEYKIVVTNSGNVTLENITLSDVLKVGEGDGKPLTATQPDDFAGTLAPGASVTYTASYTVLEADLGKTIVNTATATGSYAGETVTDDGQATANTAAVNPDLTVEKTITNGDTFAMDDSIAYEIVVTNSGNVTLTGIDVTDSLVDLENTTNLTLKPNETVTFTPTYQVTMGDVLAGQVVNTATATAGDVVASDKATATITGLDSLRAEVVLNSKSYPYDGENHTVKGGKLTVKLGDAVQTDFSVEFARGTATATYKDVLYNEKGEVIGYPVTATAGDVIICYDGKDVTEQFGNRVVIKPGKLTINPKAVEVKAVDQGPVEYGTLVNELPELTIDEADLQEQLVNSDDISAITYTLAYDKTNFKNNKPLVGEHTIKFVDPLENQGNYTVTFVPGTLTVTAPDNLNDYVVKTHKGQNFKVGDTVTFEISVTNIYAVNATVTLEEMAGMTFGNGQTTLEDDLDPGETKIYTATRTLTDADFEAGGVNNEVNVTLTPEGGDPTNGTGTDEVELEEKPDMSVVKTVLNPKESYRVGDTIRYQITVTNTGNVTLHDLELTDVMNADGKVTFPAGTDLTRETLNVGDRWTVTCSYVVRAADEGKTISNTAKVISRDDDGNPNKDGEDTTPGESVQKRYSLTIHYRNGAGNAVAGSYSARYHVGDSFKIVSPIVAGYYDPQTRSISSGANGMPAQDLEYVVIYTAIPVPAPDPGPGPAPNPGPGPGPAPNPGPDDGDDDDDTPPVPDPEQELPPQPQDFEIDPDDYTLTELEDNETPLANLDLDGHTCCILHLLLMLAAMVVLGFYTKSRKKHQARIFELKRILAAEEDHPDDPQQP